MLGHFLLDALQRVHLPNPFYQGSSDGESEQGQVQAEELTEEGVVVVTLSDSEGE